MITVASHLERLTSWANVLSSALSEDGRQCACLISEVTFQEGTLEEYEGNAFATYGGAIPRLERDQSPTGQTLPFTSLLWEVEYDDLNGLENAGLIPLIYRRRKVVAWKDRSLSPYTTDPGHSLGNMLMVQDLSGRLRDRLSPMIGESMPSLSTIETILQEELSATPGIKSAQYQISSWNREGRLRVSLSIECLGYLESMTVNVEVTL